MTTQVLSQDSILLRSKDLVAQRDGSGNIQNLRVSTQLPQAYQTVYSIQLLGGSVPYLFNLTSLNGLGVFRTSLGAEDTNAISLGTQALQLTADALAIQLKAQLDAIYPNVTSSLTASSTTGLLTFVTTTGLSFFNDGGGNLGAVVGVPAQATSAGTAVSPSAFWPCNLARPATCLVRLNGNVPSQIRSVSTLNAMFCVPNNVAVGRMLALDNASSVLSNVVRFPSPIELNSLDVSILDGDNNTWFWGWVSIGNSSSEYRISLD